MSTIRNILATVGRARALPLTFALAVVALSTARAQGPSDAIWAAPARASLRANPVPATTAAVKQGQSLFHRDCEQCHGKAGRGDGPQSGNLQPKPADFTSERVQSQSDGALFWKMSEGRGAMPRASLSEKEKWAVIDYLRTLAGKP